MVVGGSTQRPRENKGQPVVARSVAEASHPDLPEVLDLGRPGFAPGTLRAGVSTSDWGRIWRP